MEFPYSQRQQWQRHVIACDRRNPEVVEGHQEAKESSLFTSIGDKEQVAWLRERQRRRR